MELLLYVQEILCGPIMFQGSVCSLACLLWQQIMLWHPVQLICAIISLCR